MPKLVAALIALFSFQCCTGSQDPLLERQATAATNITFTNTIFETDDFNVLKYEYIYNGGGIGVGDFDNNGLPDLYFAGNMVPDALYLQQTPWSFKEVVITPSTDTFWTAGVNVHDVNGDGYEDIYLSVLSPEGRASPNRLYLNKGLGSDSLPTFEEVATRYGVADAGYGTHSAWVDLENDGDLDLFVLNNAIEENGRNLLRGTDTTGTASSTDVLYLNTDDSTGNASFVKSAVLKSEGWGLGLVPGDFNQDGRTDVYVANDFWSEDQFLINRGDGGLEQRAKQSFPHTSRNSMGVDAADLNNDGRLDIVTVDMLPNTNSRQKTMFAELPSRVDERAYRAGYGRQYIRNALQIDMGDGTYADLALQMGAAATDWSWAPLLADFNNDGYRDLFISNGYPKDVTNHDFVDFGQNTVHFGKDAEIAERLNGALNEIGGVHQPNVIYQNGPDLNFSPSDWLSDEPTYSNGAVYVDLDLDGDLDLVTNNINEPAGVYRNQSRERSPETTNYLRVDLNGPVGNPDGLGAKLYAFLANGEVSYLEQQRQRGYLSTIGATLHFGLAGELRIDSLAVRWPDGGGQVVRGVAANQVVSLRHEDASERALPFSFPVRTAPALSAQKLKDAPVHRESKYSDLNSHALAVRDNSKLGPVVATADLDGDGTPEIAVGGAAGQTTKIYTYDEAQLAPYQSLPSTESSEATSLEFFDADGDGDDDLYIGNGSSEFAPRPERYRDRLYRNEGGRLILDPTALPDLRTVTSSIVSGDVDGDGDPDLFVGARNEVGNYPRSAPSLLLVNEAGKFSVRKEFDLGLVTAAVWGEFDDQPGPDLVVVSEYGAPQISRGSGDALRFEPLADVGEGWWYSVSAGDVDNDGQTDLLLGNVGLNSSYRASATEPLTVRVDDYDNNGTLDPIMLQYIQGQAHPVHPRNTLGRQLPGFKRQATTYAQYGTWTGRNMPPVSEAGFELRATEFRSFYLHNDGGKFTALPLPTMGQTAPIRDAILTTDARGRPIFLAVQNDYATEVLGGRLDAGNGFALRLDGDGKLIVDHHYWSVRGDARSLVRLGDDVLVGVNDGPMLRYVSRPSSQQIMK